MAEEAFEVAKRHPFARHAGVLGALSPVAFQKCFEAWVASITLSDKGTDANPIAIDGKVLRRSHHAPKCSPWERALGRGVFHAKLRRPLAQQ